MKNIRKTSTIILILLATAAVPVFADHHEMANSFAADWKWGVDDARGKLIQLAEAIPEDKYSWKPNDEVRSVSEVFMHVVLANYFIGGALGLETPEGISPEIEKSVTSKKDVVKHLKDSFEHLAAADTDPSRFDEEIQLFGNEWPRRRVFMLIMAHAHEHLGQGIAYTRSLGIVPPWSNPQ